MSFVDETAIVATPATTQLTPAEVLGRIQLVQQVMKSVMKDKEHYGTIPGCGDKPTLLQPGAQVLATTFQLAPEYDIIRTDLGGGHREETVKCLLYASSGLRVGMGIGCCSTMESKYRYRTGPVEFTGKPVPADYWDARDQKLLGGKGYQAKKNPDTGKWEIVRQGEKVENADIADTYNTVLKIAKKRAFVDAVLTATAASDMFTQDLEDIAANAAVIDVAVQDKPKPSKTKPPQAAKNPLLANVEAKVSEYMTLTGMTKGETVAKMEENLEVRLKDIGDNTEAVKAAEDVIQWLLNSVSEPVYETEDIPF